MSLTENSDELRALLALGVIAGIGIIFQLETSHLSILSHLHPTSLAVETFWWFTKFSVLIVFSLYIVILVLALGFADIEGGQGTSDSLAWFARGIFIIGGFSLILALVAFVVRLLVFA
jgi:hypothetical protein